MLVLKGAKMVITKQEYEQLKKKRSTLVKQLEDLDKETAVRKSLLEGRLIEVNEIIFNVKIEEEK